MIDTTLRFLAQELDTHLSREFDFQGPGVILGQPGDKSPGSPPADGLILSLLSVTRDPSAPHGVPQVERTGDKALHRLPPLVLSVDVLLSARFPDRYDQGLAALSGALAFFQSTPYFQRATHPGMPQGVDRLGVDLSSLTMYDLTSLWSVFGGQFLPSVCYTLRLIAIDGGAAPVETGIVKSVNIDLQKRPDKAR